MGIATRLMHLAAGFVVTAVLAGCAHEGSRFSFALEQRPISFSAARDRHALRQRIMRETTLDDMPSGHATEKDAVVRVFHSGVGPCSGGLVGPRHVITAAHCVVEHDKGRFEAPSTRATLPARLHVELGGDYLPWGRVGVVGVKLCDDYVDDAEHDLAMLLLSQPVPEDVPVFAIAPNDFEPSETAIFVLDGFGSGGKPVVMPESDWGVYSVKRHTQRGPSLFMDHRVFVSAIASVPGDSGGPIVDAATGQVVSVVSRGRKPNALAAMEYDNYTMGPRLANCRKTISEMLAR